MTDTAPTTPRDADLGHLLARLHESGVSLQVQTIGICHLVTLKRRAEASGVTAFTEDELIDTLLEVQAFVEPDGDESRLRATTALRHLREQRLITRIDGGGITRSGRFALSRLGAAIADFYGQDERLDAESLTVLTRSLRTQLQTARENASGAMSSEAWRLGVTAPLGVTARDLVAGIERRQRGLDAAQERIRERIAHLLRDDWFRAIETCELLLDETANTLSELNTVLLRETTELHGILQDIEQLARDARPVVQDAVVAVQHLADEVDRVSHWGASRQRAWSDYYQYVQRFLRDVVRLDPGRALSQRLRDHMRAWLDHPYRFTVAVSLPVPTPRPLELPNERPPITRPVSDIEVPIDTVELGSDGVDLEARVQELLKLKPASLAAVLQAVVAQLPDDERYRDVGRLTALVAEHARLSPDPYEAERPWVEVGARIEVEDWGLAWERARGRRK
jgi:chromosome partition protein MukF